MLLYEMSEHAYQRAKERFSYSRDEALNNFNQLIKISTRCTDEATGSYVYYHKKSNTTIVVDQEKRVIVTVYKGIKTAVTKDLDANVVMITDDFIASSLLEATKTRMNQITDHLLKLQLQHRQNEVMLQHYRVRLFFATEEEKKKEIKIEAKPLIEQQQSISQAIYELHSRIDSIKKEMMLVLSVDSKEYVPNLSLVIEESTEEEKEEVLMDVI